MTDGREVDEGYVDNQRATWRRRLFVAALIVAFLFLVWCAQVVYENWRVNSGPGAWFIVVTPVTRGQPYAASERRGSGAYATKGECNAALGPVPPGTPVISSCRKLLRTDAAKMPPVVVLFREP